MALVLNEDQQLLKSSAADFVKNESPVARIRQLRDSEDPTGFSRDLWGKVSELGWPAILVPEEYGGLGMGFVEIACVFEECGRNLVPEPLLSSAVLGASAVLGGGDEALKKEVLPSVADGSRLLALAQYERGARYDRFYCETTATERDGNYVLSGEKALVIDGHTADQIVIVARVSGEVADRDGLAMFLVDRDTPGLEVVRQTTVHLRNAAIVRLTDVEVAAGRALGKPGDAAALLDRVIDAGTLALSAEMLGAMQATFEMTLDYLKTRQQFGVVIGTFQALKHRAAKMFVEIELAKSAVLGAASALDADPAAAAATVSLAKARCSDAAVLVGYEGIQMHGGIGMTDEHDVGFYAKYARGAEMTFGDAAYHRARFATLQGF